MNFAREGLLFIAIAALIAAGAFGFAIYRRSWGLWLLAFVLLLLFSFAFSWIAATVGLAVGSRTDDPVSLVVAPLTHAAGPVALATMAFGATQVILPGFDAGAVLKAFEREIPGLVDLLLVCAERLPENELRRC